MTPTTNGTGGDQILKQDELGRVRTPRAQREAILDQFEQSGMSGIAFAAHVGVKYPTFAHWLQQRRKAKADGGGSVSAPPAAPPVPARWLEVVAGSAPVASAGVVAVVLPGGARIEVRDCAGVALAAELIGRLGGVRPC